MVIPLWTPDATTKTAAKIALRRASDKRFFFFGEELF
jgi:hypothetical protein